MRRFATPSGVEVHRLSSAEVTAKLSYDLGEMKARGVDWAIVEESRQFNGSLGRVVEHPIFGAYLSGATPSEVYIASGVRILPLDGIRAEIIERAPGSYIFSFGYLPIASSVGGSLVAFDVHSDRVVWVDRSLISDGAIYVESENGDIVELPLSRENVADHVVPLSQDVHEFFSRLVAGELEDLLDGLD